MMDGMMGGMGWTLFSGAALMIGLLLLVAIVVVWQRMGEARGLDSTYESPLDILRRRLAMGEIAPEEFDRLKQQKHQ